MAITSSAGQLGRAGEEFVSEFLISKGLTILARNWRIREGEIDIVAMDAEGTIIFVEVKSRSSAAYGDPLESISGEKAQRLARLALAWLATNQRLGHPYRIDVAGVTLSRSGEFILDYREAVI